jgi:O-antigen/teichoic acid export membrane protein
MLKRNIARTLLTEIALMPAGVIVGILTARFLGPSDRGLLTALLLIPATCAAFLSVNLDTATIYFHKKHRISLSSLLANSITYALTVGSLASVAVWYARGEISYLFDGATSAHLIAAVFSLPLRLVSHALNAGLKARQDFKKYNLRYAAESLLTLVGVAYVFLVLDGGLLSCLVVYPLVQFVICIWLLVDLREDLKTFPLPSLSMTWTMMRYGLKNYATNIAKHVHYRIDIYLIAFYLTNAEIALYSIGARLAERVLMVPTAMTMVIFPRLAELDAHAAAVLTARACRQVVIFSTVAILLILASGYTLVTFLYGNAYGGAVVPMYIIAFGVVSVGVTRVIGTYLGSINRHEINAYILPFSAAVNVILNLALIPGLGIAGAALASLITYTAQSLAMLIIFIRLSGLRLREVVIPSASDFGHLLRPVWRRVSASLQA